eukprot:CAMPEP_0172442230 /NCGR_PEP_ID=MMETSP1065-20121228/2706_1 /TAXON_ID=265537 /ORGANISM="Amphiprora paludosa, Strain CCMP125" /LENGTH=94 /DNA_ID=CAMNT_0013192015 /DNA_START=56 /DNA_END=337 /DNA_ORIENTATION=-
MYQLLLMYKYEHGHFCPTTGEVYQGKLLGKWVVAQRSAYEQDNGSSSSLSPVAGQRVALLNQIGFTWYDKPQQPRHIPATRVSMQHNNDSRLLW